MRNEKLFHVGVKALITNSKGKILLLKANPANFLKSAEAHWDIPGGRININEDINETFEREIKEETGITITGYPEFYTAVISNIEIPISEVAKVGLVLMVYKTIIPENTTIVVSAEHTEYNWFDPLKAARCLEYKYPLVFTKSIKLS